jgi:hypothetical protein
MRLEKDKSESIKLKDAVYYQALEIMDEEDLEVGRQSLNPVSELKAALNRAARGSGLSRAQVVDKLNVLIQMENLRTRGKDGLVTEAMLDKWLAPGALDEMPPVKLLPIVCAALESLEPLAALARPLGAAVIGEGEQLLLEMARAQLEEKRAAKRRRRLAEQVEEIIK